MVVTTSLDGLLYRTGLGLMEAKSSDKHLGRFWYEVEAENGFVDGKWQITKGLLEKYGIERVRDTPITEVGKIMKFNVLNISFILHIYIDWKF